MNTEKTIIITITDTDSKLGMQVQSDEQVKSSKIVCTLFNAVMMEMGVSNTEREMVFHRLVDAVFSDEGSASDQGEFKTQLVIRESADTLQLTPVAEGLTVGRTRDMLMDTLFMAFNLPEKDHPHLKKVLEDMLFKRQEATA